MELEDNCIRLKEEIQAKRLDDQLWEEQWVQEGMLRTSRRRIETRRRCSRPTSHLPRRPKFWSLHQGQSARSWTQLYRTVPQPNPPVFDGDLAGDFVFWHWMTCLAATLVTAIVTTTRCWLIKFPSALVTARSYMHETVPYIRPRLARHLRSHRPARAVLGLWPSGTPCQLLC